MSTIVLPKRVRLIGLLINEITFDVFVVNNQLISAILSSVLSTTTNETYIGGNALHILGRMQITLLEKIYANIKWEIGITQNWLSLLTRYIYDCYKSTGSVVRMMETYLDRDINTYDIESMNRKITREITKGNYVTAQAVMFELLATEHNPYTHIKPSSVYQSNDFKYVNFKLDNTTYVRDKFIQNSSCINYELMFRDITPDIGYSIPIVQNFLQRDYINFVNPIIVFVEYTFDKQHIEKALQILESIMFTQSLNKLDKTEENRFLIEAWYTILKTVYEQQKDNHVIKIIQSYTPYMYAYIESLMRDVKHMMPVDDANSYINIELYLLMPVAIYVQILNSMNEHDMLQFIKHVPDFGLSYPKIRNFLQPQLICAYYSMFLSDVFDCLIRQEICDSESVFLFEVIFRNLLSLTTPSIGLSGKDVLALYLNRYNQLKQYLIGLADLTERHILPIPTFVYYENLIHHRELFQRNVITCAKTDNIAYMAIYLLKRDTTREQVCFECDLLKHVPPVYRQMLSKDACLFTVYIVPAKVR